MSDPNRIKALNKFSQKMIRAVIQTNSIFYRYRNGGPTIQILQAIIVQEPSISTFLYQHKSKFFFWRWPFITGPNPQKDKT